MLKKVDDKPKRRRATGKTLESREKELISLAVRLAEKQLSEGTASAQVITHYLKLGSTKERLEKERLIEENQLLRAKTESLRSAKRGEELYLKALDAMRSYGGHNVTSEEDNEE